MEQAKDGDGRRTRCPFSFYKKPLCALCGLARDLVRLESLTYMLPLCSLRLCERDFVRLESLTYGLSQPSFHGER